MSVSQLSRKADAHSDAIWCVTWLSDTALLSGSLDGLLKCWEVAVDGDSLVVKWTSEPGEFLMGVVSIARLSATSFAASSMDGEIRIFVQESENYSFKIARRIEAGPVDCWTLCASSDGSELASGTSTGAVNLWDVSTGKLRRTYETHGTFALAVARSEDTVAVGTRDGSVYLINLLTSEVLPAASRFHHLPVRHLAFNSDGTLLYTASDDGLACVVSSRGGEKVGAFKGHLSGVLGIAVSSTCVVTASADRRVRVWDAEDTKEVTATFDAHAGQAFCVAFSPGQKLLVSGGAAGELQLYAVASL